MPTDSPPESRADQVDREAELARINAETAKIAWHELQKFFAQGKVVQVLPALDLLEVAYEFSCDNKKLCESWLNSGKIGAVSDAQAQEWLDANALMWAVVVRPWILIQPLLEDEFQ